MGDKERMEQLKKEYKQHLDLVEYVIRIQCAHLFDVLYFNRRERQKYYYHQEKSRSEPEKYLTIIINGMDQNKTNVPTDKINTESLATSYSPHGCIKYTQDLRRAG